ncbi:hypothetical protein DN069_20420 [Streptacidiphilus pinicola]|uniref:Uncharacterized protein n=1 Tax=Streptacidiphilus pinicola TaxID=2219663 RepID=A0A2X0J0T2_9ACTN|nr:hypothetical protein [Streptacidiphilus pinicola]RAG83806.1 hypothetical protein DN069_20420 [Streptacidiphilus pinicola]
MVSMIAGIAALLLVQLPLRLETAAVCFVLAVLGPDLSTVDVALFRLPDAIVLPAVVVLALVAASASAYRRPDLLARSPVASLASVCS